MSRSRGGRAAVLPAVAAMARVVVLEAIRGRVAWLMLLVVVSGYALGEFVAQVAITESREIARGVLAAWLRLGCVFVSALFVATSMMRDWSDKGMELVLAHALPRSAWLAGRLLGYAAVSLLCTAACVAMAVVVASPGAALIWGATLAGEVLLVATLTLLCMLTFNHMPLALGAVAGFYLLSRAMDAIVLMSQSPLPGAGAGHGIVAALIEGVAFLLPDLDRFARAQWLMDAGAGGGDLLHAAGQTVVYLALLVGAALFDLERKVL